LVKANNIIIVLLVVILIGAGSFFAGMKYQQSKRTFEARQFEGRQRMGGVQGIRAGFRPVSGEIIESGEKSITVKLTDGSSKIILLSDKTQINKADSAVKEDLKVGEKVMVIGQENSDGSVTAQNIQLSPVLRRITGGSSE